MPSMSNDKRVLLPVLLFLGIDPRHLVDEPFHGAEDLFQQPRPPSLSGSSTRSK